MKPFFIILFLGFSICLYSQEVIVSDAISIRSDARFEILGKIEKNTLVFLDKTTSFELVAFNSKMRRIWQKELQLDKKYPKVLSVTVPDDTGFYVAYTHRLKNHTLLKIHHYDHTVNVLDTALIMDFGSRLYSPRLQTYQSEDKTKLLFYEIEGARIKKTFVFDTNTMELLWKDDFSNLDLGSGEDLHQIVIDNVGNVYLILARDNFVSKNKTHHFEIIERNIGSTEKPTYTVKLDDVMTYDNTFDYDNLNQNIVGAGLYSERNRGRAEGYYYLKIPKGRSNQYVLHKHEFDDKFVEEYMDKDNVKNKGINDTEIREILFRRDGGVILIGERSKLNARDPNTSTYYSPYLRSSRDYFYNNLFVFSIHPTGEMHWQQVLHKKQYSYDDDGIYSSYFLLKSPSSIRLIFNDDIKNENTVSEYKMKGNGVYERNSVLNTKNRDIRLQFREAVQIGAKELVVPSERRNKLRLMNIRF